MGNKTTKDTTEENTMEEQNELNDLKQLMERQQKTLTETMSAMELKATALQEKLDKKAKLSSANAEAGVKKIAIEYKVVELKIEHELPPGFGEPKSTSTPSFGSFTTKEDPRKARQGDPSGARKGQKTGTSPFNFAVPDDQATIKECEEKARQQYREFEETKLKELGEEGWTLRSIGAMFTPTEDEVNYTNLYYFSRPL